VPPTDQTAKDTPLKGSNRKDNAPNGPNRKWAISALATAQASLQPSTS
jgi:hypothetical protein